MEEMLKAFQEVAGGVGSGAGRKFGREAIASGGEYARARRAEKASWQAIADELGVGLVTAKRWATREATTQAFHRVSVIDESERVGFTAVLPGGVRVEGLDITNLVALAKALS